MEILLVAGDFVKTGGMDVANHALASYLADRGDVVHLAAFRAADDLLARSNVIFHRAPKPLDSYSLGNQVLRRSARRHAARLAARGARVLVNGGNCDWGDVNWVIHLNAIDVPPPRPRLAGRLKSWIDYRIHIAEEKTIIPKARVIFVSCERTRVELLKRMSSLRPEDVNVVYLGVDPQAFRPASPDEREVLRQRFGWAPGRPKILFVGALGNHRKGFDILFEAWRRLCRSSSWDADLVVAGDGAELPYWRAQTKSAGLTERIEFLGTRRDVADLFRASEGHVLPSRYEGYSMVTQEALSCGVPAIITRASGIAERYPEELQDLVLPDPEDVSELVARLTRWRERIGRSWPELDAFAAEIRAFDWMRMSESMAKVIARES
ncbi:MAG TPA: glycosyltransferase family 4 protein [Polyangiaceae bacterium]|nr:glycosyltransferase family 4 protein [Polyangiaceae bacterium]